MRKYFKVLLLICIICLIPIAIGAVGFIFQPTNSLFPIIFLIGMMPEMIISTIVIIAIYLNKTD